jgi:hypothetical protein
VVYISLQSWRREFKVKGAGTLWETTLGTQTDSRRRGRPCNTLFPVLRKEPTNCHLTEHTAVPNGLLEIGALLDVTVRRSVILAHEAVICKNFQDSLHHFHCFLFFHLLFSWEVEVRMEQAREVGDRGRGGRRRGGRSPRRGGGTGG